MKKKIIIGIVILVIIILAIIGINLFNDKVTNLEKIKIEEFSNDTMNYYEYIDNFDDKIDRYILFVLNYKDDRATVSEIKELVDKTFNVSYSEDDYIECGISPLLLDYRVNYDPSDKAYYIDKEGQTLADIADKKIYSYYIKDIKKKSRNNFEVTYEKYVIETPYEVLNYYTDMNMKYQHNSFTDEDGEVIQVETDLEPYDTDKIVEYLKGGSSFKEFRKNVTKEVNEEIGTQEDDITVNLIIKDGKMLVNN